MDLMNLIYLLIDKVLKNLKVLIISNIIFGVILIPILLRIPNYYTSKVSFIASESSNPSDVLSKFGALAGFAGVDIEGAQGTVSPDLYGQIINSWNFQSELIKKEYAVSEQLTKFNYSDYYFEIRRKGFFEWLLPQKKDDTDVGRIEILIDSSQIHYLSKEEYRIQEHLKEIVSVFTDRSANFSTISAVSQDPILAADLCRTVLDQLSFSIKKIEKSRSEENLKFISSIFKEKNDEFLMKQKALDEFEESNYNVNSPKIRSQRDNLKRELNVITEVVISISKQLEEERIKINNNKSLFTVVERPSIANEKSGPSRSIALITALFLFNFIIVSTFIVKIIIKNIKHELPKT